MYIVLALQRAIFTVGCIGGRCAFLCACKLTMQFEAVNDVSSSHDYILLLFFFASIILLYTVRTVPLNISPYVTLATAAHDAKAAPASSSIFFREWPSFCLPNMSGGLLPGVCNRRQRDKERETPVVSTPFLARRGGAFFKLFYLMGGRPRQPRKKI